MANKGPQHVSRSTSYSKRQADDSFRAEPDPPNIRLEPSVTIKSSDLEVLGENFEKKIQTTLPRIWGEKEPAPAEA
jgi:hypothetical protein